MTTFLKMDKIYKTIDAFAEIQKQIEKFHQNFKELKEKSDKIKSSDEKWILYKEMPISALQSYDPDKKEFENFIKNESDLSFYVNEITKNKNFKRAETILKKAINSHINKDFEISIPLLLICIDGAFYSYGLQKKIISQGNNPKLPNKKHVNFKNTSNYLDAQYSELSRELIEFMGKDNSELWNFRNEVLHGVNPLYANSQWSIKLIFLIFLLTKALK